MEPKDKNLNNQETPKEEKQELDLNDLEAVSGGGSAWSNVPTVPENPYPVNP